MLGTAGPLLQGCAARTVLLLTVWSLRHTEADISQCKTDTFGLAGTPVEKPFETGVERLRCKFDYVNGEDLPLFVLNYYPSIQHFADYNGTDLVPKRHWEYPEARFLRHKDLVKEWQKGVNGPKYQTEAIQLGECSIPQADGGGYIVQRVGPLVSTGNYDYWQFGWHDVWSTSRLIDSVPGGIAFTSSFSGPVDPNGFVIGHPPIHIHHIHISPEPGVATKMNALGCQSGEPKNCYVANLAVEQHGDYQCTEEDGGIDCFFEKVAHGFAKNIDKPFDLEGEVNDVRAPDSEPMTWWYQVVLRWHPRRSINLRPLSQHFIVGPGKLNPLDQRNNVAVFPVRSQKFSVYWYTGFIDRDGSLARNKLHSHNTMFDSAFYFAATPADLGLDAPGFMPEVSYIPRLLHKVGFKSIEDLQRYIFAKVEAAAKRYDEECVPPGKCKRPRPQLVCQSWVSNLDFVDPASGKTFAYDRRAPCCCRPWKFHKGDQFTSVAFMAPMKTPPGPWSPDRIPEVANMHIHWLMTYESFDNQSHYTTAMYAQNPNNAFNYGDGTEPSKYPLFLIAWASLFSNQGTRSEPHVGIPNWTPSWYEWSVVNLLLTVRRLRKSPQYIVALVVAILLPFGLCFYACGRRILRRRRTMRLAVSTCAQQVPCCADGVAMVADTVQRCTEEEHSD